MVLEKNGYGVRTYPNKKGLTLVTLLPHRRSGSDGRRNCSASTLHLGVVTAGSYLAVVSRAARGGLAVTYPPLITSVCTHCVIRVCTHCVTSVFAYCGDVVGAGKAPVSP
jgi:hypothetical protein